MIPTCILLLPSTRPPSLQTQMMIEAGQEPPKELKELAMNSPGFSRGNGRGGGYGRGGSKWRGSRRNSYERDQGRYERPRGEGYG